MPYRIDISCPTPDALDVLVRLGAIDIEQVGAGIAAIMPDSVTSDTIALAFDGSGVKVSSAVPRDDRSVWLLSPRAIRINNILIASPEAPAAPNALRLVDSHAFGTGHHPTTALCLEAIEETLAFENPGSILDVGIGSGILALAALMMGVPQAVGLDTDADALQVAAVNARLNGFADRLKLVHGAADAVDGQWPLVVANVLAAPLIEMAPVLVRRVGRRGRLILSGVPSSLDSEVRQTYQHLGMRQLNSKTQGGWAVLSAQASW